MASKRASATAPEEIRSDRLRRARLGRRAGVGLMVVFVGAGLLNLFGSHSAKVTATRGGMTLTVTYPDRTRPALPVRWKVDITSAAGFSQPVHLAVNLRYFNFFDFNNFYPTPDSTENRGDLVVFTFATPPGNTLTVLFDGRMQPGRIGLADAETKLLDDDGSELVGVAYSTKVFP